MKEDKQKKYSISISNSNTCSSISNFPNMLEQKWDKCVQMYHKLAYVNGTCNKEQKQFKSSTHAKKKKSCPPCSKNLPQHDLQFTGS